MRASPGTAAIADAVWDEVASEHGGAGTFGSRIGNTNTNVTAIKADYAKGDPYTYSGGLAAGAYYVPAAGSWVTVALLSEVNKLEVYHSTLLMLETPGATLHGFFIDMHADGTNLKFKNTSGVERVLDLYGVTL